MSEFLNGNKISEEPNLLFDKFDSSTINSQVYWGLRQFGPYDKNISSIKIFIISPNSSMNKTKSLIDELQQGVSIFPGGMPKFFHCNLELVGTKDVDTTSVQDYEAAANWLVNSKQNKEIDVVFVYIPKTGRYFPQTPYYRTKGILASRGFCSQMVTEATFSNLKWSYLNLAIAIFAKAGGTPWVLESAMPKTDMILGISVSGRQAYKQGSGSFPRYLGYANVFDNNGRWMFFEGLAKSYEKGKSDQAVKEIVSTAVAKFKTQKNSDPKDISIHYHKKFGRQEKEAAIKTLTDELGDCNIAFVSIDDSHPFRIFDKTTQDGSFRRRYYAYFKPNEVLLSTTGQTEIAGRRMGTPKLLNVKLSQNNDTYFTMDEITEQVFSLTKLNWATATPLVREPVTLQFSKSIAYLTAAISEQEWSSLLDPSINTILNNRPWFI